MKIIITGHTRGIGLACYNHFSQNHECIGVSRTNGYDISKEDDRKKIIALSADADMFINNAYFDPVPTAQFEMLKGIVNMWNGKDKIVLNISSRYISESNPYSNAKRALDDYATDRIYIKPFIINLKPGLTDTPRVANLNGNKLAVDSVIDIIEYVLTNKIKIHAITFGL